MKQTKYEGTISEEIKIKSSEFTPNNFVEEHSHPSFGQLQISRVSGHTQLYGSSIEHHNYITLKIYPSTVKMDLGNEWYFANSLPYIEIAMSQVQFAEAITSFNIGNGVPCTITYNNGYRIQTPKFESKKEMHRREFSEYLKKHNQQVNDTCNGIKTVLDEKQTIGKKDREDISKKLDFIIQAIGNNISFYDEQFQRQMDRTVMEAKGEVDAFITGAIHKIGIEGLKDHLKHIQITDMTSREEE